MKFPLRCLVVFAMGLCGLCAISPVLAAPGPQELEPGSGPISKSVSPANPTATVVIPGPLRSFLRLAGISQEVTPSEVLAMLSHNVFVFGYTGAKETEFLVLIDRYLHFARELQSMTSSDGVIRVGNCQSALPLVHALGFKFEHGCSRGSAALAAADSERAFLTVDSGFPITKLEQSLQRGEEFAYPFPATPVPVLFQPSDWTAITTWRMTPGSDLIDVLLHDRNLGRLYSAMARMEPRTRELLFHSPGLKHLLPYAATFDLYGSQISMSAQAVQVPGGVDAEPVWQTIAGASPHNPGEFVLHLLSRDRGWLAAYFDAVTRVSPAQQRPLLSENRIRTLYDAYRATGNYIPAAAGVFPRNVPLMLLLNRIQWDANGQPEIPGSLKVWQEIFAVEARAPDNKVWARFGHFSGTPDHLLESVAAAANILVENSPAQIYEAVSDIDARRAADQRLSADTVHLLADRYADYHTWYVLFADFPQLEDGAISAFVKTADHVNGIAGPTLRANALGAFQADLGLWQILARQKQIPAAGLNTAWLNVLEPFTAVTDSNQLFDAARASLGALSAAAGGSSTPTEDEIVDLLAGPAQKTPDGGRVHDELARRIHAVLDDQRLASLDTLFGLYDGLEALAKGRGDSASLIPLAQNLHEFEMPQPIFTGGERAAWSPLIYTSRHAELQVQTDLTRVLRTQHTPQQLEAARTRLAPFLRDTLVGLNYAYYEPPGAQVLHNNPLFVRSHDFTVTSVQGIENVWGAPDLIGVGATAGGGAYLMGSLAGLPYALADVEDNFIAPEKVQALIWRQTAPQLLVDSVLPRWWGVDKDEMHAAALYQRAGEELLTAAESNPQLREQVSGILSGRLAPSRLEAVEDALDHPQDPDRLHDQNHDQVLALMLPSDTFYLAVQFRKRYPDTAAHWGPASKELNDLGAQNAAAIDPERIAADFGVPHPAFDETDTSSLENIQSFPASDGEASRLFGESWESTNLYWARLADQMGYSPVMLNLLAPDLTRRMVSNIFATYLDDWPALLRAMDQTGDEFRQGKFVVQTASRGSANGNITNGSAPQ